MTRTQRSAASLRRRPAGERGAWWFARWLLVLVLAFDQLSAPFHSHHHDGAEGQLEFGAGHAAETGDGPHAENGDDLAAAHFVMAIRVTPSRLALPVADRADAHVAWFSVGELLTVPADVPVMDWRPDRSPSDFRSHRSLPPAGRAPPLHS